MNIDWYIPAKQKYDARKLREMAALHVAEQLFAELVKGVEMQIAALNTLHHLALFARSVGPALYEFGYENADISARLRLSGLSVTIEGIETIHDQQILVDIDGKAILCVGSLMYARPISVGDAAIRILEHFLFPGS